MQKHFLTPVLMVTLLLVVIVPVALAAAPLLDWPATGFGVVEARLPVAQAGEEDEPELATASVIARLSNQPGRTLVTARANHFVVDSPPLLGGPNEEINPIDLLLAALASCSTFVYETAAQELDVPLEQAVATVEADFDPRGVMASQQGGSDLSGVLAVEADHDPRAVVAVAKPIDPRIQAFRVHLALVGPTREQAEALADQFRQRCPVYTTLSRAAPVEIETTIGETMAAEVEEQ